MFLNIFDYRSLFGNVHLCMMKPLCWLLHLDGTKPGEYILENLQ